MRLLQRAVLEILCKYAAHVACAVGSSCRAGQLHTCLNLCLLSCRARDIRFSVYDNLLLVHCLPLCTTTVYDLLLPTVSAPSGHGHGTFPPVHTVQWNGTDAQLQAGGDAAPKAPRTQQEPEAVVEPDEGVEAQEARSQVVADEEDDEVDQGETPQDAFRAPVMAEAAEEPAPAASRDEESSTSSSSAAPSHGIPPGTVFMPPSFAIDLDKRCQYRCGGRHPGACCHRTQVPSGSSAVGNTPSSVVLQHLRGEPGQWCGVRISVRSNSTDLRRLQLNLKDVLARSQLEPRRHFFCLCERDRVRLWPWLHGAQVEALRAYLRARPPLPQARRVLDGVAARCESLARCAASERCAACK
jgi:hypothetical protein